MAKMLDYGLELSEFVLQLFFYVLFRTNTAGKGINLFIPPNIG